MLGKYIYIYRVISAWNSDRTLVCGVSVRSLVSWGGRRGRGGRIIYAEPIALENRTKSANDLINQQRPITYCTPQQIASLQIPSLQKLAATHDFRPEQLAFQLPAARRKKIVAFVWAYDTSSTCSPVSIFPYACVASCSWLLEGTCTLPQRPPLASCSGADHGFGPISSSFVLLSKKIL